MVTGTPNHGWSTSSADPPPGGWERVHPSTTSYEEFVKGLQVGDLVLWKDEHVAFYAGGGRIFGAHKPGVNSGYSEIRPGWNEFKQYWITGYFSAKMGKWVNGHGYPQVWRQK
jgi:cell wall-associated NlpC family hydrolase